MSKGKCLKPLSTSIEFIAQKAGIDPDYGYTAVRHR